METVDFYIELLKLKQNREGLYTDSNKVKLQTVVLKKIRLSLEMTVKKKKKSRKDRSSQKTGAGGCLLSQDYWIILRVG